MENISKNIMEIYRYLLVHKGIVLNVDNIESYYRVHLQIELESGLPAIRKINKWKRNQFIILRPKR